MRRLYILSDEEFDEEFESDKYDHAAGQVENPTCPRCGRELLVAFVAEGDMEVLADYCLFGDEVQVAESWYLVCGNFNCLYEEEVEFVREPAGAVLFDMNEAASLFGEETGFGEMCPAGNRELVEELAELYADSGNRKLPSLIDDLQWQSDEHLRQLREWLVRVPAGRTIEIHLDGTRWEGYIVLYSDSHLLLRPKGASEALAFALEEISFFGPRYFRDEPEPEAPEAGTEMAHMIVLSGRERCVVKGHHLHLDQVDRFGRHHCRTWDAAVGQALGMKHLGDTCYQGVFRRTEVQGRYDLRRIVRVAGHWVEWFGPTATGDALAVKTVDPEIARALDLKPWQAWLPNADGTWPPSPFWYGFVSLESVEAQEEHPVWLRPIPEASD